MKQRKNKIFTLKSVLFILILLRILRKIGQALTLANIESKQNSIRIAAIGDSITAEHTPLAGYPRYLNHLLGEEYTVINFGLSSHAVQELSDLPYINSSHFQKSLHFKPHIVLLMLGTNDTKDRNWENIKRFKDDYIVLLEYYLALESVSRIILASPPTVFSKPPFFSQIHTERILPIQQTVKQLADEYQLEFIDITQKTAEHPQWFIDGVHPTPEGAKQLARMFYNQLEK